MPEGKFDDDEPISKEKQSEIITESQESKIDPEKMVHLTLVPKQKCFKLTTEDIQHFPFMAKLQVDESKEATGKRAPIDVVCVIDRSGSMFRGTKWEYLVQTMEDLSGLLQEYDRLSIVSFNYSATRDTKLLRMKNKGKIKVDDTMKRLKPGGNTSIGDGLQLAIKVLTDRKYQNKVSSILLLSDG